MKTKTKSNELFNLKSFRRQKFLRNIFKNGSLAVLVLISVFTVGIAFKVPLRTTDDSQNLPKILEKAMSKNILGASTENKDYLFGCDEKKPVIGWIDYSGNKIVTNTLPDNEKASACFANLKEAQSEGFFLKE